MSSLLSQSGPTTKLATHTRQLILSAPFTQTVAQQMGRRRRLDNRDEPRPRPRWPRPVSPSHATTTDRRAQPKREREREREFHATETLRSRASFMSEHCLMRLPTGGQWPVVSGQWASSNRGAPATGQEHGSCGRPGLRQWAQSAALLSSAWLPFGGSRNGKLEACLRPQQDITHGSTQLLCPAP